MKTRAQRLISCFCIASKRKALYYIEDGRVRIVPGEASEHGLGHLLNPIDPDSTDRSWIDQWWQHVISLELGIQHGEPSWFDRPAVSRLTVTSPREAQAFRAWNERRAYPDQVRPWNFCLMAHVHPLDIARGAPRCLVAPFERDPRGWTKLRWFDRAAASDRAYRIRVGNPEYAVTGMLSVKSFRDYFNEFRTHPETKAADAQGAPCGPWTRGLLQPRGIEIGRVLRIGKEVRREAEDEEIIDTEDDQPVQYREPVCRGCGVRVTGKRRWCSEACRKRTQRRRRRR